MRLDGVLFFPVTPFDAGGALDAGALDEHVERGMANDPGGVFVACGTGEYHALSLEEFANSVETAVKRVGGRVPVIAGAGGPLPHASACARAAQDAGADGLLVLPPYLVSGPQHGLVRWIEALADASDLPLILYQRGAVRFSVPTAVALARHPRVAGFKDGLGDLDLMARLVPAMREAAGEDFLFFNGLPTAELTVPAYRGIGVTRYSSAVFAFAPEIATAYHRAVGRGDRDTVDRLLRGFYLPLVALRDKVPGYAVALVKAGARLRGQEVGGVRPPLADPTPEHLEELQRLLLQGLRLVT